MLLTYGFIFCRNIANRLCLRINCLKCWLISSFLEHQTKMPEFRWLLGSIEFTNHIIRLFWNKLVLTMFLRDRFCESIILFTRKYPFITFFRIRSIFILFLLSIEVEEGESFVIEYVFLKSTILYKKLWFWWCFLKFWNNAIPTLRNYF